MSQHTHSNGRTLLGIILIIVGAIVFLKNLHFELFFIDIFSWPFAFILVGILILFNNKGSLFGLILIIIGGAEIASEYFDISFYDVFFEYWPFLIIALGIFIVSKTFWNKNETGPEIIEAEDYAFDAFSFFWNSDKYVKSNNFKGGKLTTLFGELNVNLMESKIKESPQVLDIITLFGSTEIRLPSDWEVIIKATTIFGGFEDQRAKAQQLDETENKVLIIKGLVLFGGGELRN